MHAPVLQIPFRIETFRRPRAFIPRTLTDVTPILLVEHIKVRPVCASIGIRSNRQRGSSERAACHGREDAVGPAVDNRAPGADAGGAGCEWWDGFEVGIGLLVDEEALGVGEGGVCEDAYWGGGDAFNPLAVIDICWSLVVFVGGVVDVVPKLERIARI